MTHFSVIVCTDDPKRLDEIMAPYDENREVEPYRNYQEGDPASYWGVFALRKHEGLNPDDATLTWAQVAEANNRRYDDDEPLLLDDSGRAYTMSTRNPDAKWDWYSVGGQWAGYFVARKGAHARVIPPNRNHRSQDVIMPGRCDGGRKADLDLDALREVKAAEARKTYAEYQSVVAGTPEALPWSAFRDNISEGNGYTIDQARDEYHSQPRVQALSQSEFRWYDDVIAEFGKPEKLYVEQARAQAVPGYAIIATDGHWMAPGTMGWFAMSDDSEGDRIGYWEAANAYIDALEDSTYLVALDCHI